MPLLRASASDVTASVKAGAEVNAAVGGAVAKGGSSAPPRAGGSAAASAAVTQSKAAQRSTTRIATVLRIPPVVFIPRPPASWTFPQAVILDIATPYTVFGSFNGNRIIASIDFGSTYFISTNGGASWTTGTPLNLGSALHLGAMSYDGMKVVAATIAGDIRFSDNGGVEWTIITPASYVTRQWRSIVMSSDGTKIAVTESNGYIYTTTNSGSSWTQQTSAGQRLWTWLTGSADGNNLVAGVGGESYRSTDGGATWSAARPTLRGIAYTQAVSSGDGMTLLARRHVTNYAFLSTDGGASWIEVGPRLSAPNVAISADGVRMAISLTGNVWLSMDSGVTWTQQTTPFDTYRGIYMSGNGNQIAVITASGKAYFGTYA